MRIGMPPSPHLKKMNFFQENTFPKKRVGITGETCAVKNCAQNTAAALRLETKEKHTEISNTVIHIMNSYR